jgi:hypothetical protein
MHAELHEESKPLQGSASPTRPVGSLATFIETAKVTSGICTISSIRSEISGRESSLHLRAAA